MQPNVADLLQTACAASLEAGEAIMQVYASGDFTPTYKADNSPVTVADQAAHDIIIKHLLPTGISILSEEGKHAHYISRRDWEWFWLVDPMDGTKEFVKRSGEFSVNIALMHRSIPVAGVVYAPVPDILYFAGPESEAKKTEKGKTSSLEKLSEKNSLDRILRKQEVTAIVSKSHKNAETLEFLKQFKNVQPTTMGSSLKFMLLAENKADIYPRFAPTMEWDTAAAHAVLRALGRGIYHTDLQTELTYNKEDLLNPFFVAF